MAISGKIVSLKDNKDLNIFPETSAAAVYLENGKTLEESVITYKESDKSIIMNNPDMIQKINDMSTELEKIENKFNHEVSINEFYEDDFTLALIKAINIPNISKINIDGNYIVKTGYRFENINNITIDGHCNLVFENDIEILYEFFNCKNLNLKGININVANFSNYKAIVLNECINPKLENIEIKNIINNDVEKETRCIDIYSKFFKINNISFENIKCKFLKENETTGKGAITNIYVAIDDVYKNGEILDIKSNECHNIDESNQIIIGDVDTIKTQYKNGIETDFINSKIIIKNINGENFGKRLLKLQSGGINVEDVKGVTNTGDCFSLIAVHNKNVNIENIELDSKNYSASRFFESALKGENIEVKNFKIYGTYKEDMFGLRCQSLDKGNKLIFKNGIIESENSGGLLRFLSSFNYIKFENIDINGDFSYNNGFLIAKSISCTDLNNLIFEDCRFNVNSYRFLDFTTSNINKCDIKLKNCEINYTYSGVKSDSIRLINLKTLTKSILFIDNTEFILNNMGYSYGFIYNNNLSNVVLKNIIGQIETDKSLFSLTSDHIKIEDLYFENATSEFKVGKSLNVSNVNLKSLKVINSDNSLPVNVNLNLFNGILIQEPTSVGLINVKTSDINKYETKVLLTNGSGSFRLTYPNRFYSVKIINLYSGRDTVQISCKDLPNQYYTEFTVTDSKNFSGEVDCVVLYSL